MRGGLPCLAASAPGAGRGRPGTESAVVVVSVDGRPATDLLVADGRVVGGRRPRPGSPRSRPQPAPVAARPS